MPAAQNCRGRTRPGTVVAIEGSAEHGLRVRQFGVATASGTSNPLSLTMDGNKSSDGQHVGSVRVWGMPSGLLTSWSNSFNWTGISGADLVHFRSLHTRGM